MNEQLKYVESEHAFLSTAMEHPVNAICWKRNLVGDFNEIISQLHLTGNITEVEPEDLLELHLSEQGDLARTILLQDFKLLQDYGADPILNVIKYYEEDAVYPFFPTDVYSFHVDRSPIAADTILCTYYGDASELVPNAFAQQKIKNPAILSQLKKNFDGPEEGFEAFLSENFFDLHYELLPNAPIVNLGIGNLWRLAVDSPESKTLPCIHRAPREASGAYRLLMIC